MANWNQAAMPAGSASYLQRRAFYNSVISSIKTESGTTGSAPEQQKPSPPSATPDIFSSFECYVKHQQNLQEQQQRTFLRDSVTTPSPSNAATMQQLIKQQQYQQQFQQAQQAAAQHPALHLQFSFDPLTPPGLPSAILPSISQFYHQQSHKNMLNGQQAPSPKPPQMHIMTPMDFNEKLRLALTPRLTPPMDITPPKSPPKSPPKTRPAKRTKKQAVSKKKEKDLQSICSEEMKSVNESEDEDVIWFPVYNSHGKMKKHKCKTCRAIFITKASFWEHLRTHIKPGKVLQCDMCPFVTELKHHLQYHVNLHQNIKPFKCDECEYTCVNNSMLASHRKSHSPIYRYRCLTCDYASKYCHSMKMHLRKHGHLPGVMLDEDGNPNPDAVFDVDSSRRGPKSKKSKVNNRKKNENSTANTKCTQQNVKDSKLSTSEHPTASQSDTLPTEHHQMPISPSQSPNSEQSIDLSQQLTQQLPKVSEQTQSTLQQSLALKQSLRVENSEASTANSTITETKTSISTFLPPLATFIQQNAYFNVRLLAAQQQVAVLAQLPPSEREQALQQLHNSHLNRECDKNGGTELERSSSDTAMDLSQGLPAKDGVELLETPSIRANLRVRMQTNASPIIAASRASKRKGRVLKLQEKSDDENASATPSPSLSIAATSSGQIEENSVECEDLTNNTASTAKDTNTSSAASSSGNSSKSYSTSAATTLDAPAAFGTMYECKYCDIYFKDAVLYTIHMGYHNSDDPFKCNMCGEQCQNSVGLFVHMARNAHS